MCVGVSVGFEGAPWTDGRLRVVLCDPYSPPEHRSFSTSAAKRSSLRTSSSSSTERGPPRWLKCPKSSWHRWTIRIGKKKKRASGFGVLCGLDGPGWSASQNQPTHPDTQHTHNTHSATPEDIPADTPANRQRGWVRMALQILFLGPTRFSTFRLVERRLLVSPVIQTFVYSKVGSRCVFPGGRLIAVRVNVSTCQT